MICPACERELAKKVAGGVTVDVCEGGCGGIWFDQFELRHFDEPHESEGEALLDTVRDDGIRVDHGRMRNCPKCPDLIMMRHFFSVRHEVEVDECPGCGGVWLDAGELAAIRSQYGTESERREATAGRFGDLFEKDLAEMRAESGEALDKSKKIANMLRFVCPSYYIPGKQRGGAF